MTPSFTVEKQIREVTFDKVENLLYDINIKVNVTSPKTFTVSFIMLCFIPFAEQLYNQYGRVIARLPKGYSHLGKLNKP